MLLNNVSVCYVKSEQRTCSFLIRFDLIFICINWVSTHYARVRIKYNVLAQVQSQVVFVPLCDDDYFWFRFHAKPTKKQQQRRNKRNFFRQRNQKKHRIDLLAKNRSQ